MKKNTVYRIVGIVLIVIALVVMIIGTMAGSIVKTGVEKAGSKVLQVKVELEKAKVALHSGNMEMHKLIIHNPEGYQNPTFLELSELEVDADLGSLIGGDEIHIEKMLLNDMSITVEQKGITNNLNEILNNLPKSEKPGEPAEPKPEGKKLIIDDLQLTDIKVRVKLLPIPGKDDTVELTLAPIQMNDVGKNKPVDAAILTGKIMLAIAEGIATQAVGKLPVDMVKGISSSVTSHGLEAVKMGTDAGSDVGKSIIDGAGGVTEGIKGLLGGKKD